MAEQVHAKIRDDGTATCSDCQATLTGGYEGIRDHTLKFHGREPHFDATGTYPNHATYIRAQAGAFPELMMAC